MDHRLMLGLMLVLSVTSTLSQKATQLFRNPEFEQKVDSSNWECNGCSVGTVKDSFKGNSALIAYKRTKAWMGPSQRMNIGSQVKVGSSYEFSVYVKLEKPKTNTKPQKVMAKMLHTFQDGKNEYQSLAMLDNVGATWVKLGADIIIKDFGKPLKGLWLYMEGPDSGVNILLDSASLTSITVSDDWKAAARKRIENIRKGDLTVTLQSDKPLQNVVIKVEQLRHEFGFGTAVNAGFLQTNTAYRKWFLDNFEWAVIENDMKWRQTEWTKGRLTFDKADNAMKIFEANGKKVRGHAVFWAAKKRNPDWVQKITNKTELYEACMKRVSDIVPRYRGRIQHWDVNNEMVPNSFYADTYGSQSIRYDMFRRVKKADPKAKLFLNDFNIVNNGMSLSTYVRQAKTFLAAKVPVEGIGAQGHFKERPTGPVVLNRLDKLASIGLPIWITELDYGHDDDQERADGLEDALLAFFSHPKVKGVLLWGYYEGKHWRGAKAALVNGADMTPNAAGLMWQRLFHKDWRTDATMKVGYLKAGKAASPSTRAFYGDYKITVSTKGTPIHTENVTIAQGQGQHNVNIQLSQPVIG